MLTFKEFMKIDEAGTLVNPLTQVGGNYGTQVNNPYWAYGGRWGKLATADLTRHDQLLYHVARLLTEVEKLVVHRQKLPKNAPFFHQDMIREFSDQNIQILIQLGVLRVVPPATLIPQIQQLTAQNLFDAGLAQQMLPLIQRQDPSAVGYTVDEHKIQELQGEIMKAQNDDKVRHWLGSTFDHLFGKFMGLATSSRLSLNPAIHRDS